MSDRTTNFVIPKDASASNSIHLGGLILVGLDVPALEATTTQLAVEHTTDADSVADASATWKPIYNGGTTQLRATVVAGTPRYVYLTGIPPLGRIRLSATIDAGTAVVQSTAARTIVPVWASIDVA